MKFIDRRYDLAVIFRDKGYKVGAEIGVAGARYSECLCQVIPGLKLYCVDTWQRYPGNRRGGLQKQHDDNYELAQKRLAPFDATLIKKFSMDAVKDFADGSLDFVYIDANHDFDFVMEDIINWAKKVKKGGMVSGHDYYQFHHSGVVEAVDAYVKTHNLELGLTSHRHDNGERSWFFEV